MKKLFDTALGESILGSAEELQREAGKEWKGKVDLLFTSPPFPLRTKKKYGNKEGAHYVAWLASFARTFRELLQPRGSIVIELGNAWEPGRPAMSTLPLEALLAFLQAGDFVLCQQFIYYNPARLPGPAQWVNVERIRVKDAYTHIWWMAKTDRPKSTNRRVLKDYSAAMLQLLKSQRYTSGRRPSEHNIGAASFLKRNRGAIPSNVITAANTKASSAYLQHCRKSRISPHPARMPDDVAEFFIRFLTVKNNLVLDPFAGSNTTGAVAEQLGRRWVAIESNRDYIAGSRGRFA